MVKKQSDNDFLLSLRDAFIFSLIATPFALYLLFRFLASFAVWGGGMTVH